MTTYTVTDTHVAQLQADAKAIADLVATFVPDPDPNPLQVALDAANATITQLTSDNAALTAKLQLLGSDIDAVDLAVEKAKADE